MDVGDKNMTTVIKLEGPKGENINNKQHLTSKKKQARTLTELDNWNERFVLSDFSKAK